MNEPFRRTRLFWIAVAAIVLSAALAYAPGVSGPLLMDDHAAVMPLLQWQLAGADWLDILVNAPHHIRGRIVANASFLVSQALSGSAQPSIPALKIGNLLIHLLCSALVMLLAHGLCTAWDVPSRRVRWCALVAGAVFLLHPLLVSTTLYAVQRMAQLATLFSLLAVFAYVAWRRRIDRGSASSHVLGILSVLAATGLAVLSKESGVLVPLLIGTVEVVAFRLPPAGSIARSRFETGFGICCAAPLVLGLVLALARFGQLTDGYALREFTMAERALTEIHVLWMYLADIALPKLTRMGLYHDGFPIVASPDVPTVLLGLLYVSAIALAVLGRRKIPAVSLAVLWFFASHALESTLLPLELVFEHRNYLALVGPAILAGCAVASFRPMTAFVLSVAILMGLSVQTWRRATIWSSYQTWLSAEVQNHPESLRAASEYAVWLAANRQPDEASAWIATLQHRFPGHAQPVLVKLANACALSKPATLTPAELHTLSTGRIGKDSYHLFVEVKSQRLGSGCPTVSWAVLASAAKAVAANPHLPGPGRLAWRRLHAHAALEAGELRAARGNIERVLAEDPSDPRDWVLLMTTCTRAGDKTCYMASRRRLFALVGGQLGSLESDVTRLDRHWNPGLP